MDVMKNKILIYNQIFLLLFLFTAKNNAQKKEPPRLSPKAFVGQTIGYTDVKITYGTPGVKGRKIWGGLVPYGKVWRTGANEATTIEFSTDVMVNGHPVPKGKYALFTIPNPDEWTIILNKVADQWGAFKYDPKEDLLRFKVKPVEHEFRERLMFSIDYKTPYSADVNIDWEKLRVSFTIDTTPVNN